MFCMTGDEVGADNIRLYRILEARKMLENGEESSALSVRCGICLFQTFIIIHIRVYERR
jgi:hypothetical protein